MLRNVGNKPNRGRRIPLGTYSYMNPSTFISFYDSIRRNYDHIQSNVYELQIVLELHDLKEILKPVFNAPDEIFEYINKMLIDITIREHSEFNTIFQRWDFKTELTITPYPAPKEDELLRTCKDITRAHKEHSKARPVASVNILYMSAGDKRLMTAKLRDLVHYTNYLIIYGKD